MPKKSCSGILSLLLFGQACLAPTLLYAQEKSIQETAQDNVQRAIDLGQQHEIQHIGHKAIGVSAGEGNSPLPDLGDISSADLSPLAERAMGDKVMREIRRDPDYIDDPLMSDYLNLLAARLVKAGRQQGISGLTRDDAGIEPNSTTNAQQSTFEIFVARDPVINAFALPGGYIGVHTALLLAADSESELASVLGHEIGHVTQKHMARMQGKETQNALILMASMILAGLAMSRNPDAAQAVAMGGQALAAQNYLSFSRSAEREADRVGFQLLQAGGFDVRAMPIFFQRLQRANSLSEVNLPVYVRTHPLTTDRIGDMQDRARNLSTQNAAPNLDFEIVAALARVYQNQEGRNQETKAYFIAQTQQTKLPLTSKDALAQRYRITAAWAGLAFLAEREKNWREADKDLNAAKDVLRESEAANNKDDLLMQQPLLAVMQAQIDSALGRSNLAISHLLTLKKNYPNYLSITTVLAKTYLDAGRPQDAANLMQAETKRLPQQMKWWDLLAQAQAELGKHAAQHQAIAEKFALQGAWPAAIQQLKLARETGEADFYQLSMIDARLHQFQRDYIESRKDEK